MAGRPCSVCLHLDRPAIEQAMVNHRPFRAISRQFGVSKDAALRHHDDHLPEALTKAQAAEEVAQADDLLGQVTALRDDALRILHTAEAGGDLKTALAAIGQARGCIELLAELAHELDRRPVVNVLLLPEWLSVRSALLETLAPYPEARQAVAGRLTALNGAGSC
jgi:hypothetical protein